MNIVQGRRVRAIRSSEQGFSLIELGIVIAVIAVLAAVVIFGRGFIASAKITKAVDASNTVRKGAASFAGLLGGTFTASTGNEMDRLNKRQLIPATATNAGWTITGSGTDAIKMTAVNFDNKQPTGANAPTNLVGMTFTAPSAQMATDIITSVAGDPNLQTAALTVGTLTCTQPPAAGTDLTSATVTLCFSL